MMRGAAMSDWWMGQLRWVRVLIALAIMGTGAGLFFSTGHWRFAVLGLGLGLAMLMAAALAND